MAMPEEYKVLIVTLSDRAYRGEYEDLSGPRLKELAVKMLDSMKVRYTIESCLIPDDAGILREKVLDAATDCQIIFTTGGTGIGPRDITVDTIKPLLDKEIPGIMEFIRFKYGAVKRNALLSRSIAGIIGYCLVYTLPGSVRAVEEYMSEISETVSHTMAMLHGIEGHKA
jgi:molybdenum cofactor synthesis domain-containing protein